VLILSWKARFPWTNGTSCWPSPVMGDFGCVLGGQATKSAVCVRPKDIFSVNFGQEGHLPTQHPGFGSKLSSKGKPGTCALLETLQSLVNFFRRAKLLGLLYKFCILSAYIFL
jgi:hypothetical protein